MLLWGAGVFEVQFSSIRFVSDMGIPLAIGEKEPKETGNYTSMGTHGSDDKSALLWFGYAVTLTSLVVYYN